MSTLDDFSDAGELRHELIRLLFHAVVGTSRLPLTSVEAPLPAFSFGQLLYCHGLGEAGGGPVRSVESLAKATAKPGLNRLERVKLLEAFLHAVPLADVGAVACRFAPHSTKKDIIALLQCLFKEAHPLSPSTPALVRRRSRFWTRWSETAFSRRPTLWTFSVGCFNASAGI